MPPCTVGRMSDGERILVGAVVVALWFWALMVVPWLAVAAVVIFGVRAAVIERAETR